MDGASVLSVVKNLAILYKKMVSGASRFDCVYMACMFKYCGFVLEIIGRGRDIVPRNARSAAEDVRVSPSLRCHAVGEFGCYLFTAGEALINALLRIRIVVCISCV